MSLIPAIAKAQSDFDWTVYTHHYRIQTLDTINTHTSPHNVELTVHRKITKEANVLKIVNVTNTADAAQTFLLQYRGFEPEKNEFFYTSKEDTINIFINPALPSVRLDYKFGLVATYY